MPDHIPKVDEIGTSSAPLLSAAYFIGARCRPYSDDYMQCKTDANGTGELDCMHEGRKVTRCAASVYVAIVSELSIILPSDQPAFQQTPRHEHSLSAHFQGTLGLPRKLQPPDVSVSQTRKGFATMCFPQHGQSASPAPIMSYTCSHISSQGLVKEIPDTPRGEVPVHLRPKQIYSTLPQDDPADRPWRTAAVTNAMNKKWAKLDQQPAPAQADPS